MNRTEWTQLGGICLVAAAILGALWLKDLIRPGSFRRQSERLREGDGRGRLGRDPSGITTLGWLVGAAAVFFAQGLGLALGVAIATVMGFTVDPDAGSELSPPSAALTVGVSSAAGIAAGLLVWRLWARRNDTNVGLRFSLTDVPVGAVCFVLLVPVYMALSGGAQAIARELGGVEVEPVAHTTLMMIIDGRTNPWVWAVVATVVFGAPLAEELLFRVYLQSLVRRVTRRAWLAILLTSLFFAAMHWTVVPGSATEDEVGSAMARLPVMFSLFALSVMLGLAYEHTGRPAVPMTMHVLFNGSMVAYALLDPSLH